MIYDCTQIYNELDLLEIRFNVLDPYVDYFVVGESRQTFSGKEKPLYLRDNLQRFEKWLHKIIIVESPVGDFPNAFERAYCQKEALMQILHIKCHDDDIIYYGDVDEVWKPQEVDDKVYKIKQLNYSYYLNCRSSEQWIGTIVGKWKEIKKQGLNWNRANPSNFKEGGWHFTNMGGIEQVINKLESYDHQEFNTDEIKGRVKERMENGQDYVGRNSDWQGNPFLFWVEEVDLPTYLLDNKAKYSHLFK